jgi:hypothetical protein
VVGRNNLHFLVGGDFNIIRKSSDRKKKSLTKWTFYLNAILEQWGLKAVGISSRNFSLFTNKQRAYIETYQLDNNLLKH